MNVDLTERESHFAFGKNWESYARLISEAEIEEAINGLRRLAGPDLSGKRVIDIGCGSGLHALAALRLNAAHVVAVDIDSDSVATARRLLEMRATAGKWDVFEGSVFDLDPQAVGQFDVVYSWGVLHHTGDMRRALRNAAALVSPGGQLIIALYRLTWMCWFWKLEKRWYAKASERMQRLARGAFIRLFRLAKGRRGFDSYLANYKAANRGMDYYHDVHDWLGGWPYESISPAQVDRFMRKLGMRRLRLHAHRGVPLGLFGSGCDEYVYARD